MEYRINESEDRFMEVVWEVEPVGSMELVRLCSERLGWKKSTTFTVIRKLEEKGVVKNEGAVVTALIKREEALLKESDEFLNRKFKGSLPDFLSAFLRDKKLSREEAQKLEKMIRDAVDEGR